VHKRTVLALSSSGGHWVQLLRLRPAFADCDVAFATTRPSYALEVPGHRFHLITDCNRTQKLKAIASLWSIYRVIRRENPDVIVSTGALPGHLALRIGKALGKRTVWVDSVANAEELSMSGRKSGRYADLWLTQWEHLARPEGPHYHGSVL
jgi:UDP-N-acetylglucosamine:LPS N-acetylglucosamine transferase